MQIGINQGTTGMDLTGMMARASQALLNEPGLIDGLAQATSPNQPWEAQPVATGAQVLQSTPAQNFDTMMPGKPDAQQPAAATPAAAGAPLNEIVALLKNLLSMLTKLLGENKTGGAGGGAGGGANAGGGAGAAGNAPAQKLQDVGGRQAVKVDGPQGFLWKPTSDSDGKAVVLLPKGMTGKIQNVVVRDANGKTLDTGKQHGTFGDGREIFRLNKAGDQYPPGSVVEIQLQDGSVKKYTVGDPSLRHD